jgi:hypothetical protein
MSSGMFDLLQKARKLHVGPRVHGAERDAGGTVRMRLASCSSNARIK